MSSENVPVENTEEKPEIVDDGIDADQALKGLFKVLVPPENITIVSIFGKEYNRPSVIGARKQIKILRLLDELPEGISLNFEGSPAGIISSIISLASNEDVLMTLSKAMELGHGDVVKDAISQAKENKYEFDKDSPAIDLFPVEEIVAAIVPLFLRLAQRGGQAMGILGSLNL